MQKQPFWTTRRSLLGGLGGAACLPLLGRFSAAQERPIVAFRAEPGELALRPGKLTPVWQLRIATAAGKTDAALSLGDETGVSFENQLPVGARLRLRGIDGAVIPAEVTAPGARSTSRLKIGQAGTFVAGISTQDAGGLPLRVLPLIVRAPGPPPADRDEIMLLEDWRLRPDNSAVLPGTAPGDATAIWTINGGDTQDIAAKSLERIRFRFINASQRSVVAVVIKNADVWVLAIDSQPAEPFLAKNGQIILAPGTRIDAVVDAAKTAGTSSEILIHDGKAPRVIARITTSGRPAREQPLPAPLPLAANGLPQKIDLKSALRIDLALGRADNAKPGWAATADLAAKQQPALQARTGRAVVIALTNHGPVPSVFHLQGHHFRLLDRLDDGWKPFWLDTLMIDKGQTQRIAFVAEHAGSWLMEATALDWASPRLTQCYRVE